MTHSVEPPTLLLCHSSSSSSPSSSSWSFLTRLSSPPSFSVRSDCPAFLTFQLRMLEIPSSCCGLAHSLLFHPSIPSHPSSCSSPSGPRWTRADVASLSGSPSPPSCISYLLLLLLLLFLSILSERGSQTEPHDSQCGRPWDRLLYAGQQCKKR